MKTKHSPAPATPSCRIASCRIVTPDRWRCLASLSLGTALLVGAAEPIGKPERPVQGASSEFEQLANIKVTSVSRTESNVQQSPAAITVLTQEDIRRSGATSIPELLRMVPGLHVARVDGNKWAVASRGFNNRFAKNLLLQIDGRTAYVPLTAGVFWETVSYPLEDIERIEIIRGPGASVWGANAVNGVVNIVTKSVRDTTGGYVTAGGGNELQALGEARYGWRLSEELFLRVFGTGFNQASQASSEADPNDQWWRASGGLRADWEPSGPNKLTLDAGFLHSVGGARDRFATPTGAIDLPEEQRIESAHVLGRWLHETEAGSSWSLKAYWDRFQLVGDSRYRNARWNTYELDGQHQFTLGERQKVVWGLGYRQIDARLDNSAPDNGFSLSWLDNTPQSRLFSGFVQDQITLVPDRLDLTLGTKLEHNNFTGWEVQPNARLLWTPSARHTFWASASRALRTPSFTEDQVQLTLPNASTTLAPTSRILANPALQAEETWAYELGHRVQATANFSVDTALFFNRLHNLRVTQVNPALAPTLPAPLTTAVQFVNGMDGEAYGGELAAHWMVAEGWRLSGAYTLFKLDLHRASGIGASAEAAERQDPQQQVYVRSSFDLPANVQLDVIGRWVDRISGFNPTGAGVPPPPDAVSAHFALDVRVGWRPRKNLLIEVVGQNLLDARHPEFGTNPIIRSPLVEIERSIYSRLTWQF